LSNFESELGDAVETINEEQKKMKNLEETLAQQVSKLPYPILYVQEIAVQSHLLPVGFLYPISLH